MDITLKNAEINQALEEYVSNQGINLGGKHVEVTFTAGRGTNGNTAVVSIMNPEDAPSVTPVDSINLKNVDQFDLPFVKMKVTKEVVKEPADDSSLFGAS